MVDAPLLPVTVPRFDEGRYFEVDPKAQDALKSGDAQNAFDHFLRFGIDENKYAVVRRDGAALACAVERVLVSESGFCLILGWLVDEGCDPPRIKLTGGDFTVELPASAMFRHARKDVEEHVRGGAYDYGFVIFGQSPSKSLLKQSMLFQANSLSGSFQAKVTPEIVSDKRLMDTLLQIIATCEAHAGKQAAINNFLCEASGKTLIHLFRTHVAASIAKPYIQTFRPRKVTSSFITVLFGSTEPIKLQPMLFRAAGIDFGEWIYVCNSPEDADEVLRYARLMSDLYDVMITVIVLGDNAGFGAANNVAIEHAASDRIFIINPDVYPVAAYASRMQHVLSQESLGSTLWGGLLFYDDQNLMHSGMYMENDAFVRRNSLNRNNNAMFAPSGRLVRVEHFDKGVPFVERDWQKPKVVPAITGAVMVFEKSGFEKIGGFSTRYIYGHYEDADLSLRWEASVGSVCVHPDIRLVHLEGQGSRARGEEYRGASTANRYFFTAAHGSYLDAHSAESGPSQRQATKARK
ncbi:galactosyltransferase-related protein [Bradyrhizobium sp. 62]|uniref:galactosyltransferase-related protein n=1 Tax=Bradyrhizobium sp. 62 TaxID=1043588 RepID=UPI001FF979CF|nr:galactosyltransferase-related protein [Bradyrhizobium sp. 62]MCK1368320.1 glycosyltransferase [Bradyrhizobium sp. 62]